MNGNRPSAALITDCHIHIQPVEMFKPHALELMKKKRANFEQVAEFCHSPKAFLKHLDNSGIDRAVLINYVAPEVIGFTSGVNQFIADYVKADPRRLPGSPGIARCSLHDCGRLTAPTTWLR